MPFLSATLRAPRWIAPSICGLELLGGDGLEAGLRLGDIGWRAVFHRNKNAENRGEPNRMEEDRGMEDSFRCHLVTLSPCHLVAEGRCIQNASPAAIGGVAGSPVG